MDGARHGLAKGYSIEGYTIEKVLGAGGFGVTYLANETAIDRLVAIKEYLPNGIAARARDDVSVQPLTSADVENFQWGLERFKREAQTLVAFSHPNIVSVYRFFEQNGTAYLVMGYEDGQSLSEILDKRKTLPEPEIRALLIPLFSGLDHVHKAGFLHRDIKPGNIYIRKDGSPVLLDFGAARLAIGARSQSLTSIVSAGYAPFEQYTTRGNQGPWTDIYALGGVLYRAVTGQRPPDAPDRIRNDPYVPAAKAARGKYTPGLCAAIDAALLVDEEKRPQSLAQWRLVFDGSPWPPPRSDVVQSGAPTAPPPVPAPPPRAAPPKAAPPKPAAATAAQQSRAGTAPPATVPPPIPKAPPARGASATVPPPPKGVEGGTLVAGPSATAPRPTGVEGGTLVAGPSGPRSPRDIPPDGTLAVGASGRSRRDEPDTRWPERQATQQVTRPPVVGHGAAPPGGSLVKWLLIGGLATVCLAGVGVGAYFLTQGDKPGQVATDDPSKNGMTAAAADRRVGELIAEARGAMGRNDLAAAERAITAAEELIQTHKLEARRADVAALRAELDRRKGPGPGPGPTTTAGSWPQHPELRRAVDDTIRRVAPGGQ